MMRIYGEGGQFPFIGPGWQRGDFAVGYSEANEFGTDLDGPYHHFQLWVDIPASGGGSCGGEGDDEDGEGGDCSGGFPGGSFPVYDKIFPGEAKDELGDGPDSDWGWATRGVRWDSAMTDIPQANEIRPVNMAVKFMIKAK